MGLKKFIRKIVPKEITKVAEAVVRPFEVIKDVISPPKPPPEPAVEPEPEPAPAPAPAPSGSSGSSGSTSSTSSTKKPITLGGAGETLTKEIPVSAKFKRGGLVKKNSSVKKSSSVRSDKVSSCVGIAKRGFGKAFMKNR